jgi:glycyl-tRNA synthetase
MDEAGTPFCITVDGQTLEDETMTLRDRDSMDQTRMKAAEIVDYLEENISA